MTGGNFRFTSNTVNDIELFCEFVKRFYERDIIEFFKSYEGINILDNQLKDLLEAKKIQSVLTSLDNSTILRFYVIATVCVNTQIKNFFRETYFPYIEANLDNELNKVESERFKLLQSNLQENV